MTLVAPHRVVALHLQLAGTSPTTRTPMRISTTRWQVRGVRWVRYRLPPPCTRLELAETPPLLLALWRLPMAADGYR